MKKLKKSVWLPAILFIYLGCMTAIFAPELIRTNQTARLITVVVVEIIVLIFLHIFLKKREEI